MTRAHRRWHLVAWLLIGPVLVLGMLLESWLRPDSHEGPAASPVLHSRSQDRAS